MKWSQERVHNPSSSPSLHPLSPSSISVCGEDELGMTEPLYRLLVKGKGGGRGEMG